MRPLALVWPLLAPLCAAVTFEIEEESSGGVAWLVQRVGVVPGSVVTVDASFTSESVDRDVVVFVLNSAQAQRWEAAQVLLVLEADGFPRSFNTYFASMLRIALNGSKKGASASFVMPNNTYPDQLNLAYANADPTKINLKVNFRVMQPNGSPQLLQLEGAQSAAGVMSVVDGVIAISMVLWVLFRFGRNLRLMHLAIPAVLLLRCIHLIVYSLYVSEVGSSGLMEGLLVTLARLTDAFAISLYQMVMLLFGFGVQVLRQSVGEKERKFFISSACVSVAVNVGAALGQSPETRAGLGLCAQIWTCMVTFGVVVTSSVALTLLANALEDSPASASIRITYDRLFAYTVLRASVIIYAIIPVLASGMEAYVANWRDQWASLLFVEVLKLLVLWAVFFAFFQGYKRKLLLLTLIHQADSDDDSVSDVFTDSDGDVTLSDGEPPDEGAEDRNE